MKQAAILSYFLLLTVLPPDAAAFSRPVRPGSGGINHRHYRFSSLAALRLSGIPSTCSRWIFQRVPSRIHSMRLLTTSR